MSERSDLVAWARRCADEDSRFGVLADALEASDSERDLAYQDAGAAELVAGRVFEDEREGWDRERKALLADIARLENDLAFLVRA